MTAAEALEPAPPQALWRLPRLRLVEAVWSASEEHCVLRGLERFEGRSSLKTWIFVILANCARKRAERESRSLPFSAFSAPAEENDEPFADPDRFFPADHPRWAGMWASVVPRWEAMPENRALSGETIATLRAAIDSLPPSQQEVIVLRDVEGWSSGEVSQLLGITDVNARVLLHRARSKVRRSDLPALPRLPLAARGDHRSARTAPRGGPLA